MNPTTPSRQPAPLSRQTRAAVSDGTQTDVRLATALRHAAMDERHAIAEAWTQAASLLDGMTEAGRYPSDADIEDREADCLRVALALVRARRTGFEDGVRIHAWWGEAVERTGPDATREERPR